MDGVSMLLSTDRAHIDEGDGIVIGVAYLLPTAWNRVPEPDRRNEAKIH